MIAEAQVNTHRPATFIKRLCQHFQEKASAEFDEQQGHVQFAMGTCEMKAEPNLLILRVEGADTEALATLKYIVGDHLERFGHHDRLKAIWIDKT